MEDIRALSPNASRRSLIIDDIPVPSPKKDFNTLLEERLKDAVNATDTQSQVASRKFPFLKKGQGLARYRGNPENTRTRTRTRSLTLKPAQKVKEAVKPVRRSEPVKRPNSTGKLNNVKPAVVSNNSNTINKNKNINNKNCRNSVGEIKQLQLQKSAKPTNQTNGLSDLNCSDPEIKTFKELEEVRIFELMEEKAENSSFCSNSSAVIAFLQQSSPLRNQLFMQRMSSQSCRAPNEQIQVQNQQIVCTTKSNIMTYKAESPTRRSNQQLNAADDLAAKWEHFDIKEEDQNNKTKPKITNSQEKIVCTVPYGTDVIVDDDYVKINHDFNDNPDESNASLHVRFSEFNEYKTIGLSDVSTISTDSRIEDNYSSNSQMWSDYSMTSDSSDVDCKVEMIYKNRQFNGSIVRQNLVKQFCQQKVDADNDADSYDDESTSTKMTEEDVDDSDVDDNENDETSSKESHDNTILENNNEKEDQMKNGQHPDEQILFKSELLKSRLLDLEREIEVFRCETSALKVQRQKIEEERKELQKLLKQNREAAEAQKAHIDNYLMEEKKRLAREKAALASRLKDAREKAQKNKQDRDEIASLKQQVDELKEELYQKESKWLAAQARHKSQVRVLMTQNKELKEEIERLEKLKLERQKQRKPNSGSKDKTRAIHEINRMLQTTSRSRNKSSSEDEVIDNNEPISEPLSAQSQYTEQEEKDEQVPSYNIERQRHLYKNLLKDASIGIAEYEEAKRNAEEQCKSAMKESMEKHSIDNKKVDEINMKKNHDDARFALNISQTVDMSERIQKSMLKTVKEVKHVDGHIEHWYSNGNVLKIFPDKNLKKLIYYNGDVKEMDGSGKIRYFYASSRTWHTTMPDGLEIFEYNDGRIEKRTKSGKTEISYLDGSVRVWEANGLEKWTLPDGTVGETLADGSKVFQLPNGQREVHTKDYKRREYPDGTVKIVYANGSHETRYKNGRIRLRDKDGNLVLDSHQ